MGESGLTFTYEEHYAWDWLVKRDSSFVFDFLEAHGQSFDRTAAGAKDSALAAILNNPSYLYEIKILLNGFNNEVDYQGNVISRYVGTDDVNSETLTAREGGSALGNAEQHGHKPGEVLWGGGGIDTINGGANNDILLGGSGDDTLYGNDGDDRLAGNDGDDHLHGGSGINHLYGGQGYDSYYIGEGYDIIKDSDGQGCVKLLIGQDADGKAIGFNLFVAKRHHLY